MSATKPNVLFIVIDQLRADCVFGPLSQYVDLPNIRRLADDAVSFRNHYSVTSPCGPSRVSLLTGQYASNHGAVRNGTPLKHKTPNVATVAREHGYNPLLFGYTDTAYDPRYLDADDPRLFSYEELAPGFTEAVRMRLESDCSEWYAHLEALGYETAPYPEMYRPVGNHPTSPARYKAEHSDTAFLTDRTIEVLSEQEQGWFALLTYIRPHPPFVAPAPYNAMYAPSGMPKPKQTEKPDWHPFAATARALSNPAKNVEGFPDLEATDETAQMLRALYFGLATEVDHHIGRVVDWLKSSGQYDETLIVLTSDHGEMLGDYGLWGKQSFHDACFHVPLIIRVPFDTAKGVTINAPTESVDIAPTILDLIGAPIPHSMDGKSLHPLLNDRVPDTWRDYTFSELDFGNPLVPTAYQTTLDVPLDAANLAVLRKDQIRFVQFAGALPTILMDVSDGNESENIAEFPGHMQTRLDLTEDMLCHRMVNSDGTFSRTMITDDGVQVAT